jgi:hypothetical protein
MFTLIAHRLTRLTRLLPQALADDRNDVDEERQSGWHESSWVLAQGVDVIELPTVAGAAVFADTLASFYEADEEPLAA